MMRARGHDHKSYTLYHIKFYCSKATLRRRGERSVLLKRLYYQTDKGNIHQATFIFQKIFTFVYFCKRLHIDSYHQSLHFFFKMKRFRQVDHLGILC